VAALEALAAMLRVACMMLMGADVLRVALPTRGSAIVSRLSQKGEVLDVDGDGLGYFAFKIVR
jgi:hypothetical protein